MTMRTNVDYVCENGHRGVETTSENDQPYSTPWERVSIHGMRGGGKASRGHTHYLCAECGAPMTVDKAG